MKPKTREQIELLKQMSYLRTCKKIRGGETKEDVIPDSRYLDCIAKTLIEVSEDQEETAEKQEKINKKLLFSRLHANSWPNFLLLRSKFREDAVKKSNHDTRTLWTLILSIIAISAFINRKIFMTDSE